MRNLKLLTLDVGNTTIDACLFRGSECKHIGRIPHGEVDKLKGNYDTVAVVSVKPSLSPELERVFGKRLRILSLSDIPLDIDYETPETLGLDRVLFAYGVREFYSEDAVLLMVGTALVVDLMLKGRFLGGFITIGPKLKMGCLAEKAEGLREVELRRMDLLLGKNTEECVREGVLQESISFVERTASRWEEKFKRKLPVYVTGGDGKLFEDLGLYDPLILHRALHRIIINELGEGYVSGV